MVFIDSHFHSLNFQEKGINVQNAYNSIAGGIDICTEEQKLEQRQDLLDGYSHILKATALGPWETAQSSKSQLDQAFERLTINIKKFNIDFLGEFGLDNYCNYGPKEIQEYLMCKQMQLANDIGIKVIIHNREADEQILRILGRYPKVNGIIHCFSGNKEVLHKALDLGYYISFAGNVTYKANEMLRNTIKEVPPDRLLLETDSPYLSPLPKRGTANTPENMIYIYQCVATVLNLSMEQLTKQVMANFNEFAQHRF